MADAAEKAVDEGAPGRTTVGVLARAAELVDELAAHPRGARLMELAEATGLSRATVHRLLAELAEQGAVARDGRRYVLGAGVGGAHFEPELPSALRQRELAREVCQRLADQVGDTVYLAGRALGGVVYLMRCDGDAPVRVFTVELGEVKPLATSYAGLALLAGFDDTTRKRELDAALADIPPRWQPRDEAALRARIELLLAQVDEQGWCGGLPVVPGVAGVAVPVPNGPSVPALALTVSAAEQRLPARRIPEVAGLLLGAASDLADL